MAAWRGLSPLLLLLFVHSSHFGPALCWIIDLTLYCSWPAITPLGRRQRFLICCIIGIFWHKESGPLFLGTKRLVSSYLITLNQIILVFGLLVFPERSVVSVCLLFLTFCVTVVSVSPVELPSDTQPEWNWYVSEPAIHPFLSQVFPGCCCGWW